MSGMKPSKHSFLILKVCVCILFVYPHFTLAQPVSFDVDVRADDALHTYEFDLPVQSLPKALIELGLQASIAVVVPFDLVAPFRSSPIVGRYSIEQALKKILRRTPLTFKLRDNSGRITVEIEPKDIEVEPKGINLVKREKSLPKSVEEVVVIGMKASLQSSHDIKYFANGIVDAISAEDIGKFPDTNLAESVQRISGVSISRVNGEGSTVTVRGFGEGYNVVTLNGRTLPAASAPANDVANTRAFDFSALASESVSEVNVYKTSRASGATGAIGATIDIKTARPFDFDKPVKYLGFKAVNDTTNRSGRDLTPELSTLISWSALDRWGVTLFASMQERDSGLVGASVDQWKTSAWQPIGEVGAVAIHDTPCESSGGDAQLDQCHTVVNEPYTGQLYSLPSFLQYSLQDSRRSRRNAQLTFQFRPQGWITSTLDYTYAENARSGIRSNQSTLFTNNRSYLEFDDSPVKTPVGYAETIFDSNGQAVGKGIRFEQQAFDIVDRHNSLGFNVVFEPNNDFTLSIDAHDSSALSAPGDSEYGSFSTVSVGANVVGAQRVDWRGELPILGIDINDRLLSEYGSNDGVFDAQDIGTQVAFAYYSKQKTDVSQLRLDAELAVAGTLVAFGLDLREMKSHMRFSETYYTMGDWGITDPDDVPDDFFSPKNFFEDFTDFDTSGAFTGGFIGDIARINDWALTYYDQIFGGGLRYSENWATDRFVEESTRALYGQTTVDYSLGSSDGVFVAGARYEQTDVDSSMNVLVPDDIVWLDSNDFATVYGAERKTFTQTSTYGHFLPNLDVSLNVFEALKLRASFSKSIARATYGQLSSAVSGFDVFGITTQGLITAATNAGNPKLEPLESDNFDLSFEYYHGDLSYVSLGYYQKKIDNFVGIKPEFKSHFDLRDASSGSDAQQARAVLEAAPDFDGTITPTDLFNQIAATRNNDSNGLGDDTYYGDTYDLYAQPEDPLYQVATYTPVNNKEASISGFELAIQHFFGESGFGFSFNYTTVDGDVEYNVTAASSTTQFALLGLSDTLNLVAMYEKNKLQARIAYNWRDEFLAELGEEPRFTEAYSQVDVVLSYQFSEALTLSLEGLNITEENSRQHGRSRAQLLQLEQLGARYMLGAQFRF